MPVSVGRARWAQEPSLLTQRHCEWSGVKTRSCVEQGKRREETDTQGLQRAQHNLSDFIPLEKDVVPALQSSLTGAGQSPVRSCQICN